MVEIKSEPIATLYRSAVTLNIVGGKKLFSLSCARKAFNFVNNEIKCVHSLE